MHLRFPLALAAILALAACSSDDPAISMDGARKATPPNPSTCPLHLDVPAALKSAGVEATVTPGAVTMEKSTTDKPANDPIAAQQGGMSALDAMAAVYVDCAYKSSPGTLQVRLAITPGKGAANMLAPQLIADAHLSVTDAQPLLASPPGPGEVKVVAGTVAFGGVAVDGGNGAILVKSDLPTLHDDTLGTVAKTLASQLHD
jgi:hypothetical protein